MFAWEKEKNLPDDGVDKLLKTMEESGLSDSTGSFTISEQKAREKLAQFLLPEPRSYVLNLVACAVAGEATEIDVQISAWEACFKFEELSFSASELEGALGQLVSPTVLHLQELGVALNALLSLPVANLRVTSWDGESGCCYSWNGKIWHLKELSECPFERDSCRSRVELKEPMSVGRASQALFGTLPEIEELKSRASTLPPDLVVNGLKRNRLITVGSASSTCLAWTHCSGGEFRLKSRPPKADWSMHCVKNSSLMASGDLEAVLAFDLEPVREDKVLIFLVNGVEFQRLVSDLGCPFIQAVVSAPLRKNVSHTDLVEGAEYEEVLKQLRILAEDLIVNRLDSELPVPTKYFDRLLKVCPGLENRLDEREDKTQLRRLRAWALRIRFLNDLNNGPKLASLLGELHSMVGDEQSKQVRRVRAGLAEAALGAFESSQFHQCKISCERLHQLALAFEPCSVPHAQECLQCIDGLVGTGDSITAWQVLRLNGSLGKATQLADDAVQRSMMLLGALRFDAALNELTGLDPDNLDVLDALSDLRAFSEKHRDIAEALNLRAKATEIRARRAEHWGDFQLRDLVRLSRAGANFLTHLQYRGKAFKEGDPKGLAGVFCDELEKAEKALVRDNPAGLVVATSALVSVEKKLASSHAFLEAARSRVVHTLRRYGYWKEADAVLARRDVLNRLSGLLKELQS